MTPIELNEQPAEPRTMFPFLARRTAHRSVLVEFNPYQILVAEIIRPRRGAVVVESAAEFNRGDIEGLHRWIDTTDHGWKSRATVICGLVPQRSIVQRETVLPERLREVDYLEEIAEERQKGRFLSATPFRMFNSRTWTLRAVSAADGTQLPAQGPARAALLCGMPNDDVLKVQEQFFNKHLVRERIEPALLSLFGAVYSDIERRGGSQAVVIVVIYPTSTAVYILGKEGVHTPNPVLHGLDSIIETGRKELGEIDETEVLARLQAGNADLTKHAAKLVRRIGRDLKPVVDSFEMTTGQPVEEILCAYLPSNLNWLAEPLARAVGRTPLNIDYKKWMSSVGLQMADGGPTFGLHWLGALGLAANLPEVTGLPAKGSGVGEGSYHRRWHVDCSVPLGADDPKLSSRRFIEAAMAVSLATLAIVVTLWQGYAARALKADTHYWEKQMADSRKLFEELNTATATLKTRSAVLDRAYELMSASYQHSNLFIELGRTIPPRMRVDRIETNDARITISGSLLEPAEEASGTLGQHMDDIRRNPELGPLFSQIAITSLQRRTNGDTVIFELTLRLKRPEL
jgi:hypothetical protein